MAISKSERRIMALSVSITNYPKNENKHSLEDLLGMIKKRFDDGKATVVLSENGTLPPYSEDAEEEHVPGADNRNAMYIADFTLDKHNQVAKILVNRGDPDTPPQALINAQDKKVDITEIPDGYAPGNSAHIVFGFGKDHQHSGSYRAILERSTGVPRTLVFGFFNQLLRDSALELGLQYKNSQRKMSAYRPRLNALPFAGRTLKQDLEDGYVTSIELIDRRSTFSGLDADEEVSSISKRVRVGLKRTNDEHILGKLLGKLRTAAHLGDYDEIQIHLGGLSNASGTASPKFTVEMEEAAEMVYGRIETIDGFPEDLEQAYAAICDPIVDRFITRLLDDSKWPK